MNMKITMLIDVPGPVDGKNLGRFEQGVTYDVDAKVARLFMGSAMAVEHKDPAPCPVDEPAPEPKRDAMGYVVTE
jgi:hypothetical protein